MRLVMLALIGLCCQAQLRDFELEDKARCAMIWKDGVPYGVTRGDRATVTIDARDLMQVRTVWLAVENRSQEQIEIRPETFTMEYVEKADLRTARWLPVEEVYRRIERDQRLSAMFAAIGGGLASIPRPVAGATTTHQGTVTTDTGTRGTYSGTSQTTVYAPDYEARQESRERAQRAGDTARDWAEWLDRASLRRHTLEPGEIVAGFVYFERAKKARWLRITIPIGPETFRFAYTY